MEQVTFWANPIFTKNEGHLADREPNSKELSTPVVLDTFWSTEEKIDLFFHIEKVEPLTYSYGAAS